MRKINISSFEASDPEEVVVKILDMLRMLKYQPPADMGSYVITQRLLSYVKSNSMICLSANRSRFRQSIIACDKEVLTHIFAYLLGRREELRKRAYVARFLSRIEVAPELEGDNDIVQLNEQVSCLLSLFPTLL